MRHFEGIESNGCFFDNPGEAPEIGEEVIVNCRRVIVTQLEYHLTIPKRATGAFAFKEIVDTP